MSKKAIGFSEVAILEEWVVVVVEVLLERRDDVM